MSVIMWCVGFVCYNYQRFINRALTIYKSSLVKGNHGRISGGATIHNPKNITLGLNTYVNSGAYLHAGLQSKILIGDNCLISYNVHMRTVDHVHQEGSNVPIIMQGHVEKDIVIGNNVWIGYGAQILPGVIIGDNVIIGAGAVVTKNIENNSVACGVPAKIVKKVM